jgi:hypothetical protein
MADILSLLDRLIDLLKYKSERKRRLLRELYQPLFGELEKVHTTFVQAIFELKEAKVNVALPVEELSVEWSQAYDQARKAGLSIEASRQKLKSTTVNVRSKDLPPLERAFVDALYDYLVPESMRREKEPLAVHTMDFFTGNWGFEMNVPGVTLPQFSVQSIVLQGLARFNLLDILVDSAVDQQRRAWLKVCDAYADLQTEAALAP